MLVEHLIEPEFLTQVVSSRRNFNDFLREFSRQSPRVVGKLQKFSKFRKKTLQVQGEAVNEDQQTMLIELLQFIEETCLVDRNSGIDGNLSFLENCINAHQQSPSHIFCLNEPAGQAVGGIGFIYSADLNNGINPLPNQKLVQKSLDEMVQATSDFLRLSSRITFVDPYFSHRAAMLNPMVKFIEFCGANSPVESKEITILLKDRTDVPSIQFLMDAITTHNDFNSTGIASLTVTSLKERDNGEALHNRYIISELGALFWGIGLDERHSEVNDDVVMLNEEIFSKRFEQYCELKAFDVSDSANVTF
ncbi:hypothetical protein [Thalassotalea sp. PS06]|uniref:hypothetical protein n=1 Tax=Thalassotalea sp. PS06 TaxID=2594005 RepID=UPI001161DB74|nr:hypothetical protein [Thalassotalea sp. PS06]QDP01348.1 hypothetical protein FNC98_08375 [Thalassotalea sp. PS06]